MHGRPVLSRSEGREETVNLSWSPCQPHGDPIAFSSASASQCLIWIPLCPLLVSFPPVCLRSVLKSQFLPPCLTGPPSPRIFRGLSAIISLDLQSSQLVTSSPHLCNIEQKTKLTSHVLWGMCLTSSTFLVLCTSNSCYGFWP